VGSIPTTSTTTNKTALSAVFLYAWAVAGKRSHVAGSLIAAQPDQDARSAPRSGEPPKAANPFPPPPPNINTALWAVFLFGGQWPE